MDWEGKNIWFTSLLESQFFKTRASGQKFFEKLDEFIKNPETYKKQIGKYYLYALGLGFQGRLRGESDVTNKIKRYKLMLFSIVHNQEPDPAGSNKPMFEQAYNSVYKSDRIDFIKNNKPEYKILSAMAAALLLISVLIWIVSINSLAGLSKEISGYIGG